MINIYVAVAIQRPLPAAR